MLLTRTRRDWDKLELWTDTPGNQILPDKQTDRRLDLTFWMSPLKCKKHNQFNRLSHKGVYWSSIVPLRSQCKKRCCISIMDVFLDPLKALIWSHWSISKVPQVLRRTLFFLLKYYESHLIVMNNFFVWFKSEHKNNCSSIFNIFAGPVQTWCLFWLWQD